MFPLHALELIPGYGVLAVCLVEANYRWLFIKLKLSLSTYRFPYQLKQSLERLELFYSLKIEISVTFTFFLPKVCMSSQFGLFSNKLCIALTNSFSHKFRNRKDYWWLMIYSPMCVLHYFNLKSFCLRKIMDRSFGISTFNIHAGQTFLEFLSHPLRIRCLNKEIFLVCIFAYFDWIWRKGRKKTFYLDVISIIIFYQSLPFITEI